MDSAGRVRTSVFVGSEEAFGTWVDGQLAGRPDPDGIIRRRPGMVTAPGVRLMRWTSKNCLRGLSGPAVLVIDREARLTGDQLAAIKRDLFIVNATVPTGV